MTEKITPEQFGQIAGIDDWRIVGKTALAFFATGSLAAGTQLAQAIGELAEDGQHPHIDIRSDGVTVRLLTSTAEYFGLTAADVELAQQISARARELGISADSSTVQNIVVTIDALVIADVLPFWRAVLGYEPRVDAPDEELVDPHRRGPIFYFQQMDVPRPQRNRIHIDVWVPFDQAEARVAATIGAGGRLVTDKYAPGWWVLADPEGNEACVATWAATV